MNSFYLGETNNVSIKR